MIIKYQLFYLFFSVYLYICFFCKLEHLLSHSLWYSCIRLLSYSDSKVCTSRRGVDEVSRQGSLWRSRGGEICRCIQVGKKNASISYVDN